MLLSATGQTEGSLRRSLRKAEIGKYGFVEEGRVCGCIPLLGQEFVIKMY